MKIRIKDYTIRNFRSCVRTRVNFDPHLSALIGRNGSGKSNVLHAILLLKALLHCDREAEVDRATARSMIEGAFLYKKKEFRMRATIRYSTSERSRDEVVGALTQWNLKEFTGNDSWLPMPFSFLWDLPENLEAQEEAAWYYHTRFLQRPPKRVRSGQLRDFQVLIDLLRETAEFFKGISYYSASQFTDPTRCPVSFEMDDERPIKRPNRGGDHTKVLHDLYRAFKSRHTETNYNEFMALVGPGGLGLIEKFEFNELPIPQSRYEVGAGGKVIKQQFNRKLIIPSVKLDGTRLSPSQLSEGTFKTLALLYYLISDKGSLLLIEEPEVCIHHGLLKSIIELIKSYSKTKQIVVSTHSDFVLDALAPENVFVVKRLAKFGTKVAPISKALAKSDYLALRGYLADSGNLGEFWRHGGFEKND